MPLAEVVAKAALEAVGKTGDGLLSRLFGGAADEIGVLFKEQASAYRQKRTAATLARAQEKLTAAGLEAQPVDLPTLIPLLEGASLVDDPVMTDLWAGLLASAASGEPDAQHPSFSRILRELTPREAQMIDKVDRIGGSTAWAPLKVLLAQQFGCSEESIVIAHDNITRIGIWGNTQGPQGAGLDQTVAVKMREFGRAFIRAVRGPTKP